MVQASYYCHTNAMNCARLPKSGHVGCRSGPLVDRILYNRHRVSKSIECGMVHGQGMRLGQRERTTGKAGLYSSGSVEDAGGVSNSDRDRLTDSVKNFVDKNFIPLALLCAASIGYVFAAVECVHGFE